MIILKLCESGYSVVIFILVIAQGSVLNIRREEIIESSLVKREEERISFLSSHNVCSNVKSLTELCKKGEWYFTVKFLTSNSVILENKDTI